VLLAGCAPIKLAKAKRDEQREQRIEQEIVVDANVREQAMGVLLSGGTFAFSLSASVSLSGDLPCAKAGDGSSGLGPAEDAIANVHYFEVGTTNLAVPLAQLEPIQPIR